MARPRASWAWVGVALAFGGVVAWFLVASAALDDGADDDTPARTPLTQALGAGSPAVAPFTGLTELALALGDDCLRVVVADAESERAQGLRGQSTTDPYDAMLFVFPGPSTARFTMSGVPVPLDIGFYDASGQPVSRREMVPCERAEADCPTYASDEQFVYALETDAGSLSSGSLGGCPS